MFYKSYRAGIMKISIERWLFRNRINVAVFLLFRNILGGEATVQEAGKYLNGLWS